jgi:CRISPR/Cas system-associated exonuclease Cas4 (RecB family)
MEPVLWVAILLFFLWFIFRNRSTAPKPSLPCPGTHPPPKTAGWILGPAEVFDKEYVSFSRIRAFEKCPRMFELIYLYGFQEKSSRAAQVGSLVHEIIHLYSAGHGGSLSERLRGHGSVEGLLDLYDLARRHTNPTFDIPELEVRPYLENFVALNRSDSFRLHATEHECGCTIGAFNLKCVIDRIDVGDGSNPTIIDYKTGNPRYAVKRQLETYAYVLSAGKWTPCRLVFQFLKGASVRGWQYSRQLHDEAEQWLLQRIDEVQNAEVFPRRRSKLCDYCGVSEHCYRVP